MQVIDVHATQGWLWIRQAWGYFKAAPLGWMSLVGGWIIVTFGLMIVPLVGPIAANVLQPVFFAGFMLACRNQDNGKMPAIADLFAAFRLNLRALVVVGSILLGLELLIFVSIEALGFPSLTLSEDGKSIDFATFYANLGNNLGPLFLGLALLAFVKGALWFAPPLLAFHNMSAGHAMRWSFYAFLSNFSAVFVYSVLIVAMYVLALLPWGAGLFIAMPLMVISNYTGYKAMFREDEPVAPVPRTA